MTDTKAGFNRPAVDFHCKTHGYICTAYATSTVVCGRDSSLCHPITDEDKAIRKAALAAQK